VAEPIRTPGVIAADLVHTAHPIAEDDAERGLRPRRLEEFVGQEALKAQLRVSIEAARSRGEALDHVLLAGPPGLGKTSLARIVAEELGVRFEQTAGPALERKADIAAFLTALEPNAVFFVDEIHRLPRALEETFYPAMEDHQLPITVGQGAGARIVTLDLPALHADRARPPARAADHAAARPLRDPHRLEHYGADDLARIVVRSAGVLGRGDRAGRRPRDRRRARGTPAVANRLLKRVRDYAEVRSGGRIDPRVADAALDLLGVDHAGLDRLDREILSVDLRRLRGRAGRACRPSRWRWAEEADTIEDVYEPYLLQRGLLQRTPRGRCATRRAFDHLGLEPPAADASLF
jgi:Holliday junction DNA helicase RuvB